MAIYFMPTRIALKYLKICGRIKKFLKDELLNHKIEYKNNLSNLSTEFVYNMKRIFNWLDFGSVDPRGCEFGDLLLIIERENFVL